MPISLLRIKWISGTEFISIDLEDETIAGHYINTTEYWHEEDELVKYTVLCTNFSKLRTEIRITLKYIENSNIALRGRNEAWGLSNIIVNLNSKKVMASWTDVRKGDAHSGQAKSCAWLEDDLLNEMSYESIYRIARPKQSALRRDLLQAYGMCALTEVKTSAVLDAAHIIEAGKSGSYTLKNCLLLRTDLHRLFDRGQLKFSLSGHVVLSPEVRGKYREELEGKRLPLDVLKNVEDALVVRYGRNTGS